MGLTFHWRMNSHMPVWFLFRGTPTSNPSVQCLRSCKCALCLLFLFSSFYFLFFSASIFHSSSGNDVHGAQAITVLEHDTHADDEVIADLHLAGVPGDDKPFP